MERRRVFVEPGSLLHANDPTSAQSPHTTDIGLPPSRRDEQHTEMAELAVTESSLPKTLQSPQLTCSSTDDLSGVDSNGSFALSYIPTSTDLVRSVRSSFDCIEPQFAPAVGTSSVLDDIPDGGSPSSDGQFEWPSTLQFSQWDIAWIEWDLTVQVASVGWYGIWTIMKAYKV